MKRIAGFQGEDQEAKLVVAKIVKIDMETERCSRLDWADNALLPFRILIAGIA